MLENKIRMILTDDHKVVTDGLMAIMVNESDMEVIGTATNGLHLLELLGAKTPDLVILDINMPQMNGTETILKIRELYPHLKVLILSMYNSPEYIKQLIRTGVNGYILKNTGKVELLKAVREIAKGGSYFGREISEQLVADLRNPLPEQEEIKLTSREKEIVCLIALEYTSREIAAKLFISFHTVEKHRKNIMSKLNVRNFAGVVRYAIEHKLV